MRTGSEQVLDRIFILGLCTLKSLATPALRPVSADRRSLDVTAMTDRNDHVLFRDQIFKIDVADLFATDLRTSIIAMLPSNLVEIILDDSQDDLFVTQNSQVLVDLLEQLAEFLTKPVLLEIDQLTEGHL